MTPEEACLLKEAWLQYYQTHGPPQNLSPPAALPQATLQPGCGSHWGDQAQRPWEHRRPTGAPPCGGWGVVLRKRLRKSH